MGRPAGIETVATHRKALAKYEILETYEAGLELKGPEVKSLRLKNASLDGSFARMDKGQVFLYNMHVAPYSHNTLGALDPTRTRRLLLHRREIKRLLGRMTGKNLTIVPLELYFKRGWAKVRIALVLGKKGPDRRQEIRKREMEREAAREFRRR